MLSNKKKKLFIFIFITYNAIVKKGSFYLMHLLKVPISYGY